ncbi:MAG TPA: zf-HC2 domain-containing protein [Gemmataceae bacterium]|nr:zf-HC2 domain-containing protein [Gemmataceae bacterium]
MNCTTSRAQLPAFVYGDVSSEEKVLLEKHLTGCLACRQEYAALQGVQKLLDMQSPVAACVDLPRLYRAAAEGAARKARRWRRMAGIAAGLAAALAFCAAASLFEVHWETHQLVLRWRTAPAQNSMPSDLPARASVPSPPPAEQPIQEVNKQLQVLSKLIHAVVDDLQDQERQHQQSINDLLARLEALRKQNNSRYVALEKEIDTLYRLSQKGE